MKGVAGASQSGKIVKVFHIPSGADADGTVFKINLSVTLTTLHTFGIN